MSNGGCNFEYEFLIDSVQILRIFFWFDCFCVSGREKKGDSRNEILQPLLKLLIIQNSNIK